MLVSSACVSFHASPADRRQRRSSSHHCKSNQTRQSLSRATQSSTENTKVTSVGFAGVNLSKVPVLVWRRELVQRMERIL